MTYDTNGYMLVVENSDGS